MKVQAPYLADYLKCTPITVLMRSRGSLLQWPGQPVIPRLGMCRWRRHWRR